MQPRKISSSSITVQSAGLHHPSDGTCKLECGVFADGAIPETVPKCACPVLTSLLKAFIETAKPQGAAELLGYVSRLGGTRTTADNEHARALYGVQFSVQTFLPRALSGDAELSSLANEVLALPELNDESHQTYVDSVGRLAAAIRNHVANDALARGGSAMKAIYQVQYLLEQYRIRTPEQSAHIIASAFSRTNDVASAVQLVARILDMA